MAALRLAVTIPHLHRGENSAWLLTQCLRSIREVEPGLLKHVLIIDDASPHPDKTTFLRQVERAFGCTIIYKKAHTSYSSVINLGLKLAVDCGYNVVCTLNNDVILKTSVIPQVQSLFKDPRVWVSGALLYYPDGKIQHDGYTVRDSLAVDMHGAGSWEPKYTERHPVMGVTGAMQFLRLPARKYPEHYPLSYEDVEFCLRNWENDRAVIFDPTIVAIHQESATRGKALGPAEYESLRVYRQEQFNLPLIRERVAAFRLRPENTEDSVPEFVSESAHST